MKRTRKLTYSLGSLAHTMSYQAFTNRIQFFYIDVLGLGAGLVSSVWFLFGLWNAINDPLMGQLSDRTRSRWGRRIPYIIAGALPLGVSFWLLWTPPTRSTSLTLIYLAAILFVFDTLSTLLLTAYHALFPEITHDTVDRASLSTWRETMSVVGLVMAFLLAPSLSKNLGYPTMGLVIGGLTVLGYLLAMTRLKEDPRRLGEAQLTIVESIRVTLRNRPFRWFLGAALSREFNFVVLAATVPFWAKYVLNIQAPARVLGINMGPALQESLLLAVPFLLAVPSLQLWRLIAPRLGARRTWILVNAAWLPGLVVIYLARDFTTALLGVALVAPGLAGYLMLFIVLLSEITDYDARMTGQYREGAYVGITFMFMRLAFSIQALLFAWLLEPSGYVPGAATQPATAVDAIRYLIAGAPIVACLFSAACLYFVRIPRETAQAGASAAELAAAG
jgi:GPH family glycoside/pentoside/hexuronide:cation symporter